MTRTWKTIPKPRPAAGGDRVRGQAFFCGMQADGGIWRGVSVFLESAAQKEIILCKTEGLEHLAGVQGAVITCNHFHPMDSFIMQKVFDASKHPKRMYR